MAKKKKVLAAVPRKSANARRRQRNLEINQQELRRKIAASNHHTKILKILQELADMDDNLRKRKTPMTQADQAKYMTRLALQRTRLDSHFKFLKKYLPDLQSVTLQDPQGNNPFTAAIDAWAEALNK